MNLLVLSRQHSALAPFGDWLGSAIGRARLFVDADRVRGHSGFQEIRPFMNYESSARVELEALRLHREWPIGRIVATSEMDILRAGRLRTLLGLPGQGGDSAFAFRDKVEMKRRLAGRAKTVRVPDFERVHEGLDVVRFVEARGYPVIVKPVDGAGAVGTTVLRGEDGLAEFLEKGLPRGLEVEKFIAGDFYHVDGLVLDGSLRFCWPSRYVGDYFRADASAQWSKNGGFTGSRMLSPGHALTERLRAAAGEILDILPTPPSTSFHLELFHTADDELFFCEIASRTGGALVNPTFELAFGVDLNRCFVRAQAGLPVDVSRVPRFPARLLGWGLLPPEAGVLKGFRSESPEPSWVRRFQWTMKPGQRSEGPLSAVDQAANFIVEFDDDERGEERLVAVRRWAQENSVWEHAR